MSYQALNLVIHLPMDAQIRLSGSSPETPKKNIRPSVAVKKGVLRMSEFLFFLIGTMLGSVFGVVAMCLLQINRLSERKEDADAKKKCADTFPSE